eukprot:jgi/Bigna1/67860/fgenesh1_pg.4_\
MPISVARYVLKIRWNVMPIFLCDNPFPSITWIKSHEKAEPFDQPSASDPKENQENLPVGRRAGSMGAGGSRKRRIKFYRAAKEGDFKLVSKFLRKGIDPNARAAESFVLFATVLAGEEERDAFGDNNVVNLEDDARWTALMAACLKGQSKTVDLLLKSKADPKKASAGGLTPLHIAAYHGRTHAAKQLLKCQASVDATEHEKGQTPLILAARGGHAHVAQLLVQKKAGINLADSIDGMTALLWSIKGPLFLVECLLNAKADVTQKNFYGQTPLLYAAGAIAEGGLGGQGRGSKLEGAYYKDHKKEENASTTRKQDSKIQTPVPTGAIKVLLDAKAHVNAKNYDEYTALMIAAFQGHSSIAATLIKHKAELEAAARQGQTALILAASGGHTAMVERLIGSKANIRHADELGQSALIKAVVRGHTSAVRN